MLNIMIKIANITGISYEESGKMTGFVLIHQIVAIEALYIISTVLVSLRQVSSCN